MTQSPYLPPQVPEADVELVLLAGLPLVAAAVLCGERGCQHGLPPALGSTQQGAGGTAQLLGLLLSFNHFQFLVLQS